MDYLKIFNWGKLRILASGVLLGTAGVKILSSVDAKKVYTNATAAVLRVNDCLMTTTTKIQENAEDILAEAKEINRERAEEKIVSNKQTNENETNIEM